MIDGEGIYRLTKLSTPRAVVLQVEEATAAKEALDGALLDGLALKVQFATKRDAGGRARTESASTAAAVQRGHGMRDGERRKRS